MVTMKYNWESINPVSLFGFGLLAAVILGLNGALAASLATSFLLLGLFYVGQSILRHFYEAHMFADEVDGTLPRGLNLLLLSILTFGIYVVLRPYAVLFVTMSTSTLFTLLQQGGWLLYGKFAVDVVLLLIFLKHWVVVLVGDVLHLGRKLEKVSDLKAEEVTEEVHVEQKPLYAVKKLTVTLD